MNGLEMLWCLLIIVAAVFAVLQWRGVGGIQSKIAFINQVLCTMMVLYALESFQTLTLLSRNGYRIRMLAYSLIAGLLAYSAYRVWQVPWFANGSRWLKGYANSATGMLLFFLSAWILTA